ncbi:MAG: leucyl aminopeptidase [Bacteroidota bacterium]|nr:leucyl aminopeptidase [Bacteroidota bacterium]MDP4233840.1 leucyl aminopeptidase [Bacteroidota bacterium]MDP4242461.1 leucyl aminopeptidase [Bacteroidota bacterium]MDP4289049.1 leucyl aminopeptidase [Bacteroidota bacterium]
MKFSTQKTDWKRVRTTAVAFFQAEDKRAIQATLKQLGRTSAASATEALLAAGDMAGKAEETFVIYPKKGEAVARRLVLVGMGKKEKLSLEIVRRAASRAAKKAEATKSRSLAIYLPEVKGHSGAEVAYAAVEGIKLGLYKFDKFFKREEPKVSLDTVVILEDGDSLAGSSADEVRTAIAEAEMVCDAAIFAREMENEPSNNKYPETLANWAKDVASANGLKITVFGPKELKANGMIGILSVNQGSVKEARFIAMEYRGAPKKDTAPVVLIGKGITFDTGGISLKPGAGMGDMKSDMSGAATVIATLKAVSDLKLPVNVIGLISSAENMPSGSAMRPGDVITYANGLSVEVDNTDAEGRLVLADALIWASRYNPKSVIDLATLTGACVVALGHFTTGMMGTDTSMMARLKVAGDTTYERVCELPIYDEYDELIKSDVADIKNVGGRWAGAITAAMFLKRFTDYPWVHLDIAGTARSEAASDYIPKGGTGVAVRMLTQMLKEEASL